MLQQQISESRFNFIEQLYREAPNAALLQQVLLTFNYLFASHGDRLLDVVACRYVSSDMHYSYWKGLVMFINSLGEVSIFTANSRYLTTTEEVNYSDLDNFFTGIWN